MSEVALRAPASTDSLALVRLFAGSVGRHLDLPLEVEEDLKLALTEVCSAAIEAADAPESAVTITVGWAGEPIILSVRVGAPSNVWADGASFEGSGDRATLLDALLADLRSIDGGRGVGFSIPAVEPS